MAHSLCVLIHRRWGFFPSPIQCVVFFQSKNVGSLQFYQRYSMMAYGVSFTPYGGEELEYLEKLWKGAIPEADSGLGTWDVPSTFQVLRASGLTFAQLKRAFGLRASFADVDTTQVHWREQGEKNTFPIEVSNIWFQKAKKCIMRTVDDLAGWVYMVEKTYHSQSRTLHSYQEALMCSQKTVPMEIAVYLTHLLRSFMEWNVTSHNDAKVNPVGSPSGKLFLGKPPSPAVPVLMQVKGFTYSSAGIEYGSPKVGSFYYVSVPVPDDGTMRCRVSMTCPSARFYLHWDAVEVDLIVGKNPRDIRDYYTPPHDPKKWTVFRFFVKSREKCPAFATVYNLDGIFGVVKMRPVVHDKLRYSDIFVALEGRSVVSAWVSGVPRCWHADVGRFTPLKDVFHDGKRGDFS